MKPFVRMRRVRGPLLHITEWLGRPGSRPGSGPSDWSSYRRSLGVSRDDDRFQNRLDPSGRQQYGDRQAADRQYFQDPPASGVEFAHLKCPLFSLSFGDHRDTAATARSCPPVERPMSRLSTLPIRTTGRREGPDPGEVVGSGPTPKPAAPPFGKAWGLTRAQSFKHKAHQATSRGTFEVFQKSGFLMFLEAGAQPRRPGARSATSDAPPGRSILVLGLEGARSASRSGLPIPNDQEPRWRTPRLP
jgi:hypothetical protein